MNILSTHRMKSASTLPQTTFVEDIMHSTLKVADDTGSANGFYKENMMYKNIVKDEDGNTTIEFFEW